MSAKYFRLTILGFTFWGSLLFFACSKKNDSGGGGGGSTGNGTFSVMVNGKAVTGASQLNNAEVVITADPNAQFDTAGDIFVTMAGQGDTIGVHLPDRTGITDVGAVGTIVSSYGVITLPDTFYIFSPVEFNVTTLTKTRIAGTFSGSASTSLLPGGLIVTLTNGTFNLPIIP